MNIIWNPNPLATVVELDAHDRAVLRLKVENEDLLERITRARFDLDPEHRAWHDKHIKPRTLEECVAAASRVLASDYTADDELDERTADFVSELAGVHDGDCTCVPHSCMKCHAEELLGVDTIAGLGKHEASYVKRAFAPKDGPARTLDEAIAYLADYEPRNVPDWGVPHVDRWRAEAKRAHEWLVAYRAAHFAGDR